METYYKVGPYEPTIVRPIFRGRQLLFQFENGYGASVIQSIMSYGGDIGKWELAVILWDVNGYHLTYNTPITDDVIGWLEFDEVEKLLSEIENLPSLDTEEEDDE